MNSGVAPGPIRASEGSDICLVSLGRDWVWAAGRAQILGRGSVSSSCGYRLYMVRGL